jgi:DNA-binding CsgD family transcriptional regulator
MDAQRDQDKARDEETEERLPAGVCGALARDPLTGVVIVSMDGRIEWGNDQIARIFFGPGASASRFIGKTMWDIMPRVYAEDRQKLHERVRDGGRPVLLRSIWRGYQHQSWIQFVPDADAPGAEPIEPSGPQPGVILAVTRRVPGTASDVVVDSGSWENLQSQYINLGPLDALTPRELEVLALIGQGKSVKEIAALLHRSEKTIETHRIAIGKKLDRDDRVKLAEIAARAGLTVADVGRQRI